MTLFHDFRQLTVLEFNDITTLAGVCVAYYVYRQLITHHVLAKIALFVCINEKVQFKFIHRGFDLIHYATSFLLGLFAIIDRPYGGCFVYAKNCAEDFRQTSQCAMSELEKIYYLIFTAYYITDMFFLYTNTSDLTTLLIHHIVTVTLIFISVYIRTQVIGVIVMLLHDVVDIFLYGGKILIYTGHNTAKDVTLLTFAILCTWFRMINYPLVMYNGWMNGIKEWPDHPFWYFTEGFILFALMGCHIFWFIKILKAAMGIFTQGSKAITDNRSDDSD
ncbi:longevity assurance protein [Tritrichomonas foetus]|uniref:Longevity assurance protein n=1 Tax=Tritrichomonas foetus TaxID=1144522 RepID=A0A1J4J7V6_9EUKA|nr:longevity assurance protein [Tritrichomonas foetus]|eukprot:OHS93501.1 longevity assurance protein [Tritrichomonas foetus]